MRVRLDDFEERDRLSIMIPKCMETIVGCIFFLGGILRFWFENGNIHTSSHTTDINGIPVAKYRKSVPTSVQRYTIAHK